MSERPLLLDLFCCAGGAAMGYHRAGFDIIGVDINPQPNYPFRFEQADAIDYLREELKLAPSLRVAAIHASPPCQKHVQWNNLNRERWGRVPEHADFIPQTRELLKASGLPYIIENVQGAPMDRPVMLCGSMFGLGVRRHRRFESNIPLRAPSKCAHTRAEIAVYGKLDGRRIWTRADGSEVRAAKTLEQASAAMGVDWMAWDELKESIPPAYTEHLGRQLLAHLAQTRAA